MQPYYILGFGQSNMVGGADAGLNPAWWDATPPDPDVEVWNPDTRSWEVARIDPAFPASTGLDRGSSMAWHAALELHARSGRPVRLFLDAHGGTPIDGAGPEGTGWVGAGTASEYYVALSAQIEDAGGPQIDLALFAQGEDNHDAANPARTSVRDAESYGSALSRLIAQLRDEPWFGAATPFVMPELVPGSDRDHRNDVIRSLSSDDDPATDVAYAAQPFEILPEIGASGLHWSVSGHGEMGIRVVEAFERMGHKVAWDPFDHTGTGAMDVSGTGGSDRLWGNAGFNMIDGRGGHDTIDGGLGRDWLRGGIGDDVLSGGADADVIEGSGGADVIYGGAGHDRLYGNTGGDRIDGGGGNDTVDGGVGYDRLEGGAGADRLRGNEGADTILGGAGHDELHGNYGTDWIEGGTGNDLLVGGIASDTLLGGIGGDRIMGGRGNDVLIGGSGADTLRAGPGDDRLAGGRGPDLLVGGPGRDTFVFERAMGSDTIEGFEVGIDRIEVEGFDDSAVIATWDDGDDLLVSVDGSTPLTLAGRAGADLMDSLFL